MYSVEKDEIALIHLGDDDTKDTEGLPLHLVAD